jgi:hypothetical protein
VTCCSISVHERIEFGGKPILFIRDLGWLSPWFPFAQPLPSIAPSQTSHIDHQFEDFELQQSMRGQDPVWNGVLLSIADG